MNVSEKEVQQQQQIILSTAGAIKMNQIDCYDHDLVVDNNNVVDDYDDDSNKKEIIQKLKLTANNDIKDRSVTSSTIGIDNSNNNNNNNGGVTNNNSTSGSSSDCNNRNEIISNTITSINTQRETKAVIWLRIVLLLFICISAIGVGITTYYYVYNIEHEQFEETFQQHAIKIFDSVGGTIELSLGAIDSFIVDMISYTKDTNATWPYVTIPNYNIKTSKLRTISKAFAIIQYNYVNIDQKDKWEEYSFTHDSWIQEGLEFQKQDKNYHGKIIDEYDVAPIHFGNGNEVGTGPWLPTWQKGPIASYYAPYNWDGLHFIPIQENYNELFEKKRVVLLTSNLPRDINNVDTVAEAEQSSAWAANHISYNEDPTEPYGEIFYPILDVKPDDITLSNDKNFTKTKVLGLLANAIYWRHLIRKILPPGNDGIVCVFENPCNQTFTYEVNGPDVTYLGRGDLHDVKYDTLGMTSSLVDLDQYSTRDQTYEGLPLSEEACPYTLSVYPSKIMEDNHTTNNPIIFTVAAVLIFVFTSVIFAFYDRCVERRQRKVVHTAVLSKMNVSLLEQMVQERTKKLEDSNKKLEEANEKITRTAQAQLQHFACMSHEIRTPLNCILGLSSLLQGTTLDEQQQEEMKMIVSSGELLLNVVNDVLDYSKLESGHVDVDIQRINLQDTISTVVQSIEIKGKQRNVSLRTYFGLSVNEYINTDSRRLQQILYNLLGNAIKFSNDGGYVEFFVYTCTQDGRTDDLPESTVKTPTVPIGKLPNNDSSQGTRILRFAVRDYGRGIAKQDFNKIFEPFSQASIETGSVFGGTGLGLPISEKLAYNLGGKISVDSVEDEWTEFILDFPLKEPPVNLTSLSKQLINTRVFIIDNNEHEVKQISAILQGYGISSRSFDDIHFIDAQFEQQSICQSERNHVFLINNILLKEDKSFCQTVASIPHSILIMFGPDGLEKKRQGYFRSSPVRILPSLFIGKLADHLQSMQQEKSKKSDSTITPTTEAPNQSSYAKLSVLIAEDNTVNQKVLVRMLKRLGIKQIKVVGDGKDAVDTEAAEAFDIVLMDMQMPHMDGIEACRLIHSRTTTGSHPIPKVVFVSAHALASVRKECYDAGAVGFLPKPLSIQGVQNFFEELGIPD